jgi:hypothetical protein
MHFHNVNALDTKATMDVRDNFGFIKVSVGQGSAPHL